MNCELCNKATATRAITVKQDGVEKELYVCAACAAAAQKGGASSDTAAHAPQRGMAPQPPQDETPPPFVEDLVKATLGFMKGVSDAEDEARKTCPTCHLTWEKAKETGRLGCPACWRAFGGQIRETFLEGQFGRAHVGAAPAVEHLPDRKSVRAVLERDLKTAIAREDFHRAAELKRKLDDMGDPS